MHNHLCKVCGVAVAICDGESCVGEGDHYCSLHVPKEAHKDEDHAYFGTRVEVVPPPSRIRPQ
jgi:hypothetical protein